MQTLKLGQTNRVFLNTQKPVDSVKLSILKTTGAYILDSGEAALQDKTCILDVPSGLYYFDVTLSSSAVDGDCLLYWTTTLSSVNVSLESEFEPEDAEIIAAVSTDQLLVLPSFVMANHLRGITESEISATYPDGIDFRDVLRTQIHAATSELEAHTLINFTPKTILGERQEYYMEALFEKYWTVALYEQPVVSVENVKLMLNNKEVVEIPTAWIQIGNSEEGLVKVVPYAGGTTGLAYTMVYQGGLGIAIILGGANYVPDFFSYDYTAGLDFNAMAKRHREELKNAISRRVALNMLPNLDIHRGMSSESRSIDGGSVSRSFTSSATFGEHSAAIERYQKDELKWINIFKRRHLTRLQVEGY
jgi:hypothetical protein